MAISDYTMSRLAQLQNARSTALQLEQQRAQRQAEQYRQNLSYIDALIRGGTSLATQVPGVISNIAEQQAADALKEATTGLSAGELAGTKAVAPLTGQSMAPSAPGMSVLGGEQQSIAGVGEVGALPASKVETVTSPEDTATMNALIMSEQGANMGLSDQTIVDADARARGFMPAEDEAVKLRAQDMDAYVKQAEAAAKQGVVPRGMPSQDVEGQLPPAMTPAEKALSQLKPRDPQADIQAAQERLKTKPMPASAEQPDIIKALKKPIGGPIMTPEEAFPPGYTSGPTFKGVPLNMIPQMTSTPAVSTVADVKAQDPKQVATAADVAKPAVPPADQTPMEKELANTYGRAAELKKIEDPFEKAQLEFNKMIEDYKPPEYAEKPEALAKKVVEDVWKNQPAGNPILNLLSFGQYNNKLAAARRLAERAVTEEIKTLRSSAAEKDYERHITNAKMQAQRLAIIQKNENEKRKAQLRVSMTSMNPQKMVDKLAGFQEVDNQLNDLMQAGRNVIASGEQFGGGAENTIALATTLAKAATPSNVQVGGGLSALGANAGVTFGPQTTKDEAFSAAINQIYNSNLTPAAKDFNAKLILAIQQLGKAREGGKLTDKDLEFYLNNLVVRGGTPGDMLNSINYLKMTNARSQNMWNNTYNNLFADYNGASLFTDLSADGFTPEEIAAANARGFMPYGATERSLLTRPGRTPSIPSAAGQVGSAVQQGVDAAKQAVGLGRRKATGAPQ